APRDAPLAPFDRRFFLHSRSGNAGFAGVFGPFAAAAAPDHGAGEHPDNEDRARRVAQPEQWPPEASRQATPLTRWLISSSRMRSLVDRHEFPSGRGAHQPISTYIPATLRPR